ncbi:DUF427 domain-containing protein [Streptomyces sp. Act-28]
MGRGRTVQVGRDGVPVAEGARAPAPHETGRPVRLRLPPGGVRTDRPEPSATRTYCPFKGTASYGSPPDRPDAVWACLSPEPELAAIEWFFRFYDENEG